MLVTEGNWTAYIEKMRRISDTAAAKISDAITSGRFETVEELILYGYQMTYRYGEAASALAAEMYDEISAAEGLKLAPAVPAEVGSIEAVSATIRQALAVSIEMVPPSVGGMVKQAGEETMLENARRDGAEAAWIPSGDTCAFCITLASRGWQPAKNVKATHIHANCNCHHSIRHGSNNGVRGYDPAKYKRIYDNADGDINAIRRAQYEENGDMIRAQKRAAYERRTERKENGEPFK